MICQKNRQSGVIDGVNSNLMGDTEIVVQVRHDVFVGCRNDHPVEEDGVKRPYVHGVNLPGERVADRNHDNRWDEVDELRSRCPATQVHEAQDVRGVIVRMHNQIGSLVNGNRAGKDGDP